MFCDHCGAPLSASVAFCSKCGKAAGGATPMMPPHGRIAGHMRLVGILWLAMAAFRLIPGLALAAFSATGLFPPEMPRFVTGFIPLLGIIFLIGAAAAATAGVGLLMRQSWA